MPDADEYYNSDDAINRSPQLQPVSFHWSPLPSPPPFAIPIARISTRSPSITSNKSSRPGKTRQNRRTLKPASLPNPGEAVLLRHLAPNHPDIANKSQEPQHRIELNSEPSTPKSDSTDHSPINIDREAIETIQTDMAAPLIQGPLPIPGLPGLDSIAPSSSGPLAMVSGPIGTLSSANITIPDFPISRRSQYERPELGRRRSSRTLRRIEELEQHRSSPRRSSRIASSPKLDAANSLAALSKVSRPPKRREPSSETLATSPTLGQHLIQPSQAPSQQKLPALEPGPHLKEPVATSPPQDQHLPPVKCLLDEADVVSQTNDAIANHPHHQRASSYSSVGTNPALSPTRIPRPMPSALQPSPTIPTALSAQTSPPRSEASPPVVPPGLSPASVSPVHSSYAGRRVSARLSNGHPVFPALPTTSSSSGTSHPSVGTSVSTDILTPASGSISTPMNRQTSSDTLGSTSALPPSNYTQYPSAPIEGYKCTYEGCTAAPFSTQYLLNSHANVHSQDRPYFCKVKSCARSEGGKGFKRKNELIRHGLVHESPGYICPYCPDKEHKYPRPDNLQRHVRMHHEDKDKDDPKLREVLSQRPINGGVRGPRGRRARKSESA